MVSRRTTDNRLTPEQASGMKHAHNRNSKQNRVNQRQLSVQRPSDQHHQGVLQQHRHADHRPRDSRKLAVVLRRKRGGEQEGGAADVSRSGDDREKQRQVLQLGVGNQRESVSCDDVRVAENKRHRQRFERHSLRAPRTFAEPAA